MTMRFTKVIISLLLLAFLFSCGSKKKMVKRSKHSTELPHKEKIYTSEKDYPKNIVEAKEEPPVPKKTYKSKTETYIYMYAEIAKREMELYGIPASITLAQGILESGSGYGELTRKSNNHFGIKCNGWEGAKVYHDDDRAQECFRKYKDPKYSFRDHSLFLSERSRYASLFTLKEDDYKAWAKGLKKAGYATDPRYPDKLIALIERYNLHRFDEEVLGKTGKRDRTADVDYSQGTYTVKAGDTLWNIAQRNNLSVDELKKFNNLRSNIIEIGQKLHVKAPR